MTASLYVIDEQGRLTEYSAQGTGEFSESDIGLVDLLQPDRGELHDYLDVQVPSGFLDEVSHESSSHVALYDNALLLRMPVAITARKSVGLTIVLVGRVLVTIRQDDIPVLEDAIAKLRTTPLQTPQPEMLLFELMDSVVDDDTSAALGIRRRVDGLEQEFEDSSASFDLDAVSDCRRDAVLLEAVMEDQRSCLGGLQTTTAKALRSRDFQAYLRDAISHLDHNIRVAGRAEDRLDALQQHGVLKLQERQNNRLQLLTVVSTIFLPLMLITGIYGMNFRHMPELSWRYGYGIVLLIMLAIAVLLLYVLYRKQWFR